MCTYCTAWRTVEKGVEAVEHREWSGGGYANDDNSRAERGMMGSLGTPVDQPRKLLENARQMCREKRLTLSYNGQGEAS